MFVFFFFFKQKTAYEMRISDWSSDVCSSDLHRHAGASLCGRKFFLITVFQVFQVALRATNRAVLTLPRAACLRRASSGCFVVVSTNNIAVSIFPKTQTDRKSVV